MLLDRWTLRQLAHARELLRVEPAHSVREVAELVGISPFHFIRLFEAAFGETPHRVRTRERIERAKRLLGAEHSVTDVCMAIGFSSVPSFSQLFTRRVGVTPSAYGRRFVQGATWIQRIPGCLGMMTALPADAFRNSR